MKCEHFEGFGRPIYSGLVLESLFNKAAVLQASNVITKRFENRCFLVNTAKFLKTSILKNNCKRLLLDVTFNFLDVHHIILNLLNFKEILPTLEYNIDIKQYG